MAVTQSQKAKSSANSLSATWGGATTNGNALFAILATVGGNRGTVTPPSGWALSAGADNATVSYAIYTIFNASSRSGSEAFSISGTPQGKGLFLAEYSGLSIADTGQSATDATNAGVSSITTNSKTLPPTTPSGLAIGVFGNSGPATTISSPTNSFVIQDQIDTGSSHGVIGWTARILAAQSSLSTGVTFDFAGAVLGALRGWDQLILARGMLLMGVG